MKESSIISQKQKHRLIKANVFESMKDNSIIFNKPKRKENVILLLIKVTNHGSLVKYHQQK